MIMYHEIKMCVYRNSTCLMKKLRYDTIEQTRLARW